MDNIDVDHNPSPSTSTTSLQGTCDWSSSTPLMRMKEKSRMNCKYGVPTYQGEESPSTSRLLHRHQACKLHQQVSISSASDWRADVSTRHADDETITGFRVWMAAESLYRRGPWLSKPYTAIPQSRQDEESSIQGLYLCSDASLARSNSLCCWHWHRHQDFWRLVKTPQTTETTVPVLASYADHRISHSGHQVSERITLQSLPLGIISGDTIHVSQRQRKTMHGGFQ